MSAYGFRFDNSSYGRVIDGSRIVPYLIAKISMADFSYSDYTDGKQPGWTQRIYYPPYRPDLAARQTLSFVTLPSGGGEAFTFFNGIAVMFKNGASFSAPELYVFAVDYVAPSNAAWGTKSWNPDTGALIFDSGNKHLNINQILGGVSISTAHDNASHQSSEQISTVSMSAGYPAKPAFCIPFFEYFADWGIRFDGTGEEREHFFHRVRGQLLDSVMLRDEYEFGDPPPSSNYSHTYKARSTGLSILVIDASIYD